MAVTTSLLDEVRSTLVDGLVQQLVVELLKTPSQNGIDPERAMAARVAGHLADAGLDVRYQEVGPGRPNVIATWRGSGDGPSLVLNSHLDTVPVGEGWTADPLGEVSEGRITGRGAVDAKGPLAALVAAVQVLRRLGVRLSGDLIFTAVVDEEAGSRGARSLTTEITADYAVVGEPTAMRIGIAHRGSLRPVIAVHGRAAHSSRPEEGVNAIYGGAQLIDALRRYADGLGSRRHPLCGSPTAAVTMASGGTAANVIPEVFELVLDRRMIPGETEADVVAEIQHVLDEQAKSDPDLDARIERFMPTTGGPSEIGADHAFVRAVSDALTDAGVHPQLFGLTGACDMTHFQAAGIPTVVLGPGDRRWAHKADEQITGAELLEGAVGYASVVMKICGSEV